MTSIDVFYMAYYVKDGHMKAHVALTDVWFYLSNLSSMKF